jgi:beta-glucosidase
MNMNQHWKSRAGRIRRTTQVCAAGFLALSLLLNNSTNAQVRDEKPAYLNPAVSVDERISDLLSRMTLEEKIAQLRCTMRRDEWEKNLTVDGLGGVGPIFRSFTAGDAAQRINAVQKLAVEQTRLHIPVLFHDEGLHGLIANKATSFPQAIGLAATWDPAIVSQVGIVIGRESRARGIRQVLSPVVNIARDARWGRVGETYGEDPLLQSRMGVAFCSAIEKEGVITTPKHYVANYGDGGRDSYPAYLSERELREVYFPPFKACIQEGGAFSLMSSYNTLNDIPCSSNEWLLTDVLRREWGFKGFVVSDYGSVAGIREKHAVAATMKETAAKAVSAGLDMELPDIQYYGTPLVEAAKEKLVSSDAIDTAVRNILRAKFRLGLFEKPYTDTAQANAINDSKAHRALAREAARKAIVLLKNDQAVLPLKKTISRIALLGPCADSVLLGDYSGYGMKVVTLREGLINALPKTASVVYEKGCDVGFSALPPIPATNLLPAGGAPGEQGLRGEYFDNMTFSGKPRLVRTDPGILFTWAMGSPDSVIPREQFSVRWTGKLVPTVTGLYRLGASTDDGVRLWLDGKLLIERWFDRGATLDAVTIRLEAARQYDLRIDYYENSGWSYAGLVWQLLTDQDPRQAAAVSAATKANVAIVAVGIIEGEGYDRTHLELPGGQEELIRAVAATGTPTVVVLYNGNAVAMANWIDGVAAVVEAWYPGEEGGNALADVLFGEVSPGGKLPLTFPQHVGQVPLYYGHKPTGRGDDYNDLSGKPLFPFGHGLSYTTFAYRNLRILPLLIGPEGTAEIRVDVQNTGTRTGDEVVQVYTRDPVASFARPVKELKSFKRISLAAGATTTLTFLLPAKDFAYPGADMKPLLESGIINVMVGSSSEDIRLTGAFEIQAAKN